MAGEEMRDGLFGVWLNQQIGMLRQQSRLVERWSIEAHNADAHGHGAMYERVLAQMEQAMRALERAHKIVDSGNPEDYQ